MIYNFCVNWCILQFVLFLLMLTGRRTGLLLKRPDGGQSLRIQFTPEINPIERAGRMWPAPDT